MPCLKSTSPPRLAVCLPPMEYIACDPSRLHSHCRFRPRICPARTDVNSTAVRVPYSSGSATRFSAPGLIGFHPVQVSEVVPDQKTRCHIGGLLDALEQVGVMVEGSDCKQLRYKDPAR